MVKVGESDFYSAVSKMNVHPHSESKFTQWEDLRTRQIIGRSTRGYLGTLAEKEEFFLTEKLAAAAGINLEIGGEA
ncbi:hypothetical protein SMZ27_004139 [Cronobacter sakazakii]|nr:hypothetical protein [Cronobacter sakazakii]